MLTQYYDKVNKRAIVHITKSSTKTVLFLQEFTGREIWAAFLNRNLGT